MAANMWQLPPDTRSLHFGCLEVRLFASAVLGWRPASKPVAPGKRRDRHPPPWDFISNGGSRHPDLVRIATEHPLRIEGAFGCFMGPIRTIPIPLWVGPCWLKPTLGAVIDSPLIW